MVETWSPSITFTVGGRLLQIPSPLSTKRGGMYCSRRVPARIAPRLAARMVSGLPKPNAWNTLVVIDTVGRILKMPSKKEARGASNGTT